MNSQPHTEINNATINWNDDGVPLSPLYDDFYFSTDSGIKESEYVFLKHNRLPERFSQLSEEKTFTIAETGFGTGLNFLCTWQLFNRLAGNNCRLHFISIEKHPLTSSDLEKALSLWPELEPLARQLTTAYLPACRGQHHLIFQQGRVSLTLLMGDVSETLPQLDGEIDAWFLDGFTPARNPDMWQPELFRLMADKSRPDSTYATYAVARPVRQGLSEAGFTLNKAPGFGEKREMLYGHSPHSPPAQKPVQDLKPVWFTPSAHQNKDRSVIIIGAGLAGTSCARSLADRGWQVTVLDRHSRIANEASGNPQGILYAKLSPSETALSRFVLQGYCYTTNLLRRFEPDYENLNQTCGVVQLATSEKVRKRHQALDQNFPDNLLRYLQKEQLSEIAGLPVAHDGLYYPEAGWVHPPALCRALLDHPNIKVMTGQTIDNLERVNEQWLLLNEGKEIASGKTVIIAGGTESTHWKQLEYLPLKAIRGQISTFEATSESTKLSTCLCGEGYTAPAINGVHTIGATFDFQSDSREVSMDCHEKNLSMQSQWFSSFHHSIGKLVGGRVGFRCTTPDYMPVVGAVVNREQFIQDFGAIRKNLKYRFSHPPAYHEGLYVSSGHGSRGLITAPLAGEILAAELSNETCPVPMDLKQHLNPTRFLVRDLARNLV